MKINFSEDGNLVADVKFEENEMDWAKNNPNSFDNFVNNLKEMFVTSSNNKKEIHINDKNNEKEILINEKNNEKEILINEKNNEKEMRNAMLPPLIKGIETVNNISNNLYNYYINQNGEDIPDLPYK